MANDDLYSDNSGSPKTMSPRISFSYDLSPSDIVPVEQLLRSCSSSTVDFNFCLQENSDLHHAFMADELFSNGKILPSPMKTKTFEQKNVSTLIPLISKLLVGSEDDGVIKTNHVSIKHETPSLPPPCPGNEKSQLLPREDRELKQQNSKSFWRFKRSSSYGSGYGRSLCPIALLSRSHSTGSSTGSKQSSSSSSKEGFNRKYHRNLQRPPLRKTGYGNITSTSNVIRVNPVLNLGFGSFFTDSSKNKTRK